ncbi:hypothetical protein LCGC14_2206730, partial [marine sediment metagenome]
RRMAEASAMSVEGVDLDVERDAEKLQAAFEAAVKGEAELAERVKAVAVAANEGKQAAISLAEAKDSYEGCTVDEAKDSLRRVAEAVCQKDETLAAAAKALADADRSAKKAEREMRAAELESEAAERELTAATYYVRVTGGWQETIDAVQGREGPTDAELSAAENAVSVARRAVELGAKARDADAKKAQADAHRGEADVRGTAAQSLRKAALATDDVLSDAVDSTTLSVVEGRLMTRTENRGLVPYHERSEGVRVKLAIHEATQLINRMNAFDSALIVAPQELWQGLDPENKRLAHQCAAELGVTIITAEATEGDLRAEPFAGEGKGDGQ